MQARTRRRRRRYGRLLRGHLVDVALRHVEGQGGRAEGVARAAALPSTLLERRAIARRPMRLAVQPGPIARRCALHRRRLHDLGWRRCLRLGGGRRRLRAHARAAELSRAGSTAGRRAAREGRRASRAVPAAGVLGARVHGLHGGRTAGGCPRLTSAPRCLDGASPRRDAPRCPRPSRPARSLREGRRRGSTASARDGSLAPASASASAAVAAAAAAAAVAHAARMARRRDTCERAAPPDHSRLIIFSSLRAACAARREGGRVSSGGVPWPHAPPPRTRTGR